MPSASLQIRAKAELYRRQRLRERGPELLPTLSLREFAARAAPHFNWYRWAQIVGEHLEAVASGAIKRLLIFAPPSHGKSELVSRIFPAYCLQRHPQWRIGLASYAAKLAESLSHDARAYYVEGGGELDPGARAVDEWRTREGGRMWCTGRDGSATGKHMDVGILDDPIKDHKEAASATVRSDLKNFYHSVWRRRLLPGGAMVGMWTRWDEDDLAGELFRIEGGPSPEHWTIISYEALKTSQPWFFPASCRVVPDFRRDGEALCPERFSREQLEREKGQMLEYWWEALEQQRPVAGAGRGRVYFNLDPALAPLGNARLVELPPREFAGDLLIGMDFNVDPMTACVARKLADELHVHDEIGLPNSGTEEMCQEIRRRYPKAKVTVYPDPAGKSRSTSSGGATDFSILRSHGFTVIAPEAAPAVVDRVNEVNHLAKDGNGRRRIFIHPEKCPQLLEAFTRLTYKPGTGIIDKTKGYDHWVDGVGYLVHSEFPIIVERAGADYLR